MDELALMAKYHKVRDKHLSYAKFAREIALIEQEWLNNHNFMPTWW